VDLASCNVCPGVGGHCRDVRISDRLREGVTMIVLTSLVVLFLFVYLLAALLRPEWF
jgi:K+-transporting ATPase KdpF subunit